MRSMKRILKHCQLIESPWELVEDLPADIGNAIDPLRVPIIVPLKTWAENQKLLAGKQDVGVWLNSDEAIEDLEDHVNHLPLIALNFPVFSDGRPYSSARILRTRYQYQGELRATGDIRFDQLEQMYRCGFDAFELNNEKDLERAVSEFKYFSNYYQHQAPGTRQIGSC